jgi:hypothetical protein
MKQPFFKQLFKVKVLASVTMLLGMMFLLYACSEERADLENNTTESIEVADMNSIKLMVDGAFEKNIASINDVQSDLYKYVIVNAEDDSVVHAFTNDDTFKKYEDYDLVNSNMPGINGNTARALKDFNEREIEAELGKRRNTASTKNGDPNEIDHVFDFDWSDLRGGMVGHFDFNSSAQNAFHLVIDLRTDAQANSLLTHVSFNDVDTVYELDGNNWLRYSLSNSEHIVIKNTNDAMSILYLSAGTNNAGPTNAYILPAHTGTQIPNGNYNSVRVVNY